MTPVAATLRAAAVDAAHVGLGFGVLAFQKARVRRRELGGQLDQHLGEARDRCVQLAEVAEDGARLLEGRLERLPAQVDRVLDDVERELDRVLDDVERAVPGQVRVVVSGARDAARAASGPLRSFVRTGAAD